MLIDYTRFSIADQTLDLQLDDLNHAGCERVFSEKADGTRDGRVRASHALSHVRSGDALVVSKLDRLDPTVRQLVTFAEYFKACRDESRSLAYDIDTSSPAGRFFFHMIAALAEMERDLIRERTTAGLTASRPPGRLGEAAATLRMACSTLNRYKRRGSGEREWKQQLAAATLKERQ
ncbi:hypothetical protein CQW49_15135 [Methylosinus trichosporium OB3b]|uniref:Resolvase/invertase-type recombinase catalytic domain-containing protein n=1 Tax=Methylosinus trichosporium (strain ATCC 35070 / NCIMB 11131 / UNIQEM 75 / OB3b) TaxID=595536 RepID=A0A2D2D634_METT3|nr:hypothetical protein CQW49_15135 [Methylosinus trichosporium OB3b]